MASLNPPPPSPPPRGAEAWAIVWVVLVLAVLAGGVYVVQGTVLWLDRGCNLPSSVVYAVIRGKPGTWEYCQSSTSSDIDYDQTTTTSVDHDEPITTTTVDPLVIAQQEAEAQAERERQAAVDACWNAHDAAWNAWYAEYNAWLDAIDYDVPASYDYDAWLAEHPQPVSDC